MCFFNKTLQEDYIPYITRGNQTLFILDSDNIFADNKEQDRRFLLQTGSYNSNAYSLKYDIKLGQDGSDMVPGICLSEMYYIMGNTLLVRVNILKLAKCWMKYVMREEF